MWTNGRLLGGRNFPGKVRISRKESKQQDEPISADIPDDQSSDVSHDATDLSSPNGSDYPPQDSAISVKHPNQKVQIIINEDAASMSSHVSPEGIEEGRAVDSARVARFRRELSAPTVDIDSLRLLAWSGIPSDMRPLVWRLLLGYCPVSAERRAAVLGRKRQEYAEWIPQYYDIPSEDRSDEEIHTIRQIGVDAPRTVPTIQFFQQALIQSSLQRILYIWAIRHPASGYVQGINDLVTPFLTVFLSEHFSGELNSWDLELLSPDDLVQVEADCFWCLSKLLDGIQDHYTFAQPGIQRMVFKLKELVHRIDASIANHIEEQGLEFLQFAFRWFNCLLIREVPFPLVTRLWDTYLSEGETFPEFLVYVCASFLLTWSDQLKTLDFQEMVLFLQHVPTKQWSLLELETVLSKAYMWQCRFARSPRHFTS